MRPKLIVDTAVRSAAMGAGLFFAPDGAGAATAETPLSYLRTFGPRADPATELTWGLLALSVAVVLIVGALVLVGALLRRRGVALGGADAPVERGGSGLSWIAVGVGLSTAALLGAMLWTAVTMAAIEAPPGAAALTIEVRGHQWWWEVNYLDDEPSRTFATANEIHIPVGRPIRFRLEGVDVIHSFWVPALSGKTDLVPGQTNVTWLQADRLGVYRGQCAEYCGLQHTHMALVLIAEPEQEFQAWRAGQLAPASAAQTQEAQEGRTRFIARCGVCHAVRGSRADGRAGPDLTHLMSRTTLASGILPNTTAYLSGWIANPQRLKPGSLMPDLELSGPELASIRAYLLTLE